MVTAVDTLAAVPGLPDIEGYDIARELGRGAMGVVYLARDRVLDREVAIKILFEAGNDPVSIDRFLREARATARLAHPNVVTIHRAGIVGSDAYLVMELLRGRSLEAALLTDGPLSPARLLTVAIEAARGLSAAHSRGIVHRDIKPSNLFETDDGLIKVLDFGIAKILAVPQVANLRAVAAGDVTQRDAAGGDTDREAAPSALFTSASPFGMTANPAGSPRANVDELGATMTKVVANVDELGATRAAESSRDSGERTHISGTPLFMAPEVWREEGADHASDVWSLGATLYTLATGAPPFSGRSIPEIAFKILVATPAESLAPQRADLPGALASVIERALSKARAKRYASGGEMLTDLERVHRESRGVRVIEGSPYPGLRAMDAGDRDRFFGREEDVARVIERLRMEPLVVLVGPSGAGKSSLAAAGVAPAVVDGALGIGSSWRVIRVRPGRAPIAALSTVIAELRLGDVDVIARSLVEQPDALARALREHVTGTREGVLLLVDQLEELVTLAGPEERDAAAAALGRLVDLAPGGVRVLATARSDLFDRLGGLGTLGQILGRSTELVRPLAGAALRAAIVEPARAAGARFEDDAIVERILLDVGTGEGALPLVAFAMRQWWERRDKNQNLLTNASWRDVGGVAGALGAHAEQLYAGFSPEDRLHARSVFLKLANADSTRRYATRAELDEATGNPAALERVLESLSRARLLTVEGESQTAQVTIAHEALARAWPRFATWLTEGREDRVLFERMRGAAQVWDAASRRTDLLWRGALLAELTRWREVYDDTLAPLERDFADASLRVQQSARRRWIGTGAAVVLGLGTLAGAQYLAATRARAQIRELRSERTAIDAVIRVDAQNRAEALAIALRDNDPSAALAWMASAARSGDGATAGMRAMALALDGRGVGMRFECAAAPAMRSDGQRIACAVDEEIRVIDLGTGLIDRVRAPSGARQVALADASDAIAWVDSTGTAMLQDDSGNSRRLADGVRARTILALDPAGNSVLLYDRAANVLRVSDPAAPRWRDVASDVLPAVAREGVRLIHTGGAGVVLATAADGTTLIRRFVLAPAGPATTTSTTPTHDLHARVFARNAGHIAFAEADDRVRVLDLESGVGHSCVQSVPGITAMVLADNGTRAAWLARPPNGAPSVGDLQMATCTAIGAPGDTLDTVAIAPGGALLGFDADGTAHRLDPITRTWSRSAGTRAPARSPVRVLAVGSSLALLDGATGGAVTRGASPWTGALGAGAGAIVAASVDTHGRRVVIVDDAQRVFVYAPPQTSHVHYARWHAVEDRALLEAASTRGAPRAIALPQGRAGVVAAGLGAFRVSVNDNRIEWQELRPASIAAASEGAFALLAMPDGTAERIDLVTRELSSGRLLEGPLPATVVAISKDGTRVAGAAASGPVTLRSTESRAWRSIAFPAFSELNAPTAMALTNDVLGVAARRLGFIGAAGVTTIARAPAGFPEHRVTSARFAADGAMLLTTDDCTAWTVRCNGSECDTARSSPDGYACALVPAGTDAMLTLSPGEGLRVVDRWSSASESVIAAELTDRQGHRIGIAASVNIDDGSIVLAGPVATPFLVRIELPPGDPAGFTQWVANRTNVVVGNEGRLLIGRPGARLP